MTSTTGASRIEAAFVRGQGSKVHRQSISAAAAGVSRGAA